MTNTLYEALFAPHATNHSTFLKCDDGVELSYADFLKRAAQMAKAIVVAGLTPGDRIVVQTPKTRETLALYAAAIQAGGVYLPLNNAYTFDELSYFVHDSKPAVIVCDPKNEAEVSVLANHIGAALLTLGLSGGSLSEAADQQPEDFVTVPRREDDLAALLYTSGTTGRSKGAMLSHKNLLSNAQVLKDLWHISKEDKLVHALPIFHTHGLFVALNTSLLAGAQVRLIEKFDVDVLLAEIARSTLLMGVPTFYTRLLASPEFTRGLCKTMRLFISGSAPLLAETHRLFEERTGHRILERYGMTETNMITSNPYKGERIAGTVGYPLPGVEVKVTDAGSGASLGVREIGIIEVRGDNVFQGYWNMLEKTAEELREDGFFVTGDIGTKEADGRVSIVGRAKDIIISGGYNIYPKEIEDLLDDLASIDESAVFGVPHPDFGESVIAAIVPCGDGLDIDQIKAELDHKLAGFKRPREYVVLTNLPRNTMGKVQKNTLRELYSAESGGTSRLLQHKSLCSQ